MRQLLTLPVTRLSDLKAIATAQQPAATRRRIGHICAGTGCTAAASARGVCRTSTQLASWPIERRLPTQQQYPNPPDAEGRAACILRARQRWCS